MSTETSNDNIQESNSQEDTVIEEDGSRYHIEDLGSHLNSFELSSSKIKYKTYKQL